MALPEARVRSAEFGIDHHPRDFAEVYTEFKPYVARVVRRYATDPGDVDDLVQDVFLRVYRAWSALDLDRPLRPWLKTIAQRTCIDRWKELNAASRPSTVSSAEDGDNHDERIDERFADLAEILHAREINRTIHDALGALDPRHRRVLLAKELDGVRCDAIAADEGTSAQGLRATLTRARRSFRTQYLSLVEERGLAGVVLVPVTTMFRDVRYRLQQGIARLGVMTQAPAPEFVAPVAAQAVKAVFAVIVFVGATVPAFGSMADQDTPSMDDAETASSRTAAVTVGAGMDRPGHWSQLYSAGAGEPASDDGPDSNGRDGDAFALNAPDPRSRSLPDRAPDASTPQETSFLTDPNRQVHDIEDTEVQSYAFHPSDNRIVFASGRNEECEAACPALLLASDDGGATWSRLPAEGFDSYQVFVPPAFPADNRIFGITPAGSVQFSDDGGNTFRSAATGSAQFYGPAAMSPDFSTGDPRIVIGTRSGLVQYRDDVHTTGPAPFSVPPGGTLQPTYAPSGRLFVGGLLPDADGRHRSAVFVCDGDVCRGNRVSTESVPPQIRPNPSDPSIVYAFTERNVFRSADGGATFTPVARPGTGSAVRDIAFGAHGRVFAALSAGGSATDSGLWSTADEGATWTQTSGDPFAGGVTNIEASGLRILAALQTSGVACSSDGGATWAKAC